MLFSEATGARSPSVFSPNTTASDSYCDLHAIEEEATALIEKFVENLENITEQIDQKHQLERLQLQKEKWKLYGTYKYIDPTDYGVPFE